MIKTVNTAFFTRPICHICIIGFKLQEEGRYLKLRSYIGMALLTSVDTWFSWTNFMTRLQTSEKECWYWFWGVVVSAVKELRAQKGARTSIWWNWIYNANKSIGMSRILFHNSVYHNDQTWFYWHFIWFFGQRLLFQKGDLKRAFSCCPDKKLPLVNESLKFCYKVPYLWLEPINKGPETSIFIFYILTIASSIPQGNLYLRFQSDFWHFLQFSSSKGNLTSIWKS